MRIREALQDSLVHEAVTNLRLLRGAANDRRIDERETPPYAYKQWLVRNVARNHALRAFVETGTHTGGMVGTALRHFDVIYSIEIDDGLWAAASQRFAEHEHVNLLLGDSRDMLPQVLAELTGPALFWLDAHPSGPGTSGEGVPLLAELACVLEDPRPHVVLIDDAVHERKAFPGAADYPTISEIRQVAHQLRPDATFGVKGRIIRLVLT